MNDVDKSLWIVVLRDDAEGIARAATAGATLNGRVGKFRVEMAATLPGEMEKKHGPRSPEEQAKTWELLLSSWDREPIEVNGHRDDDRTPLLAALLYGRNQAVSALLAAGADPNVGADSGLNPLLVAVRQGDLSSAEALLDAGADPNRAMPFVEHHTNGHSPLVRAAGDGNLALVKLLLERGAEIDGRDSVGRTALLAACARAAGHGLFWTDMDESMDASRHRPAFPSTEEVAEMLAAAQEEDDRREYDVVAAYLIERGADIDAETSARRDGMSFMGEASGTPLLQAALHGNERTVALLLEKGASLRPSVGTTPLLAAVQCGGNPAVVRALLAAGASLDERDEEGDTPLILAVRGGSIDLIPILEEFGADLDYRKPEFGATLLHYAAQQGQTEMVRFLLDRGLDIDATCALRSTAERRTELRQGLSQLEEAASEVGLALPVPMAEPENSVRLTGVTPLMLAAKANKPETVALLLERGANPKARDREGKTARDYAGATQKSEERQRAFLASQPSHLENPQIQSALAMYRDESERDELVKNLEAMQERFSSMKSGMVDGRRVAREATLALLPE